MKTKMNEFPRDLRTLNGCPKSIKGMNNEEYIIYLLDPIESYKKLHAEKDQRIKSISEIMIFLNESIINNTTQQSFANSVDDRSAAIEEMKNHLLQLTLIYNEIADIKNRAIDYFNPKPDARASQKNSSNPLPPIDHEAKQKIVKAFAEIEQGKYENKKPSRISAAVKAAQKFDTKTGRMPTAGELKALGYRAEDVTAAGRWLAMRNDPLSSPLSNAWEIKKKQKR